MVAWPQLKDVQSSVKSVSNMAWARYHVKYLHKNIYTQRTAPRRAAGTFLWWCLTRSALTRSHALPPSMVRVLASARRRCEAWIQINLHYLFLVKCQTHSENKRTPSPRPSSERYTCSLAAAGWQWLDNSSCRHVGSSLQTMFNYRSHLDLSVFCAAISRYLYLDNST